VLDAVLQFLSECGVLVGEALVTARARYRCEAVRALPGIVPEDLPPTLCFSDTHLLPTARRWGDDAPADLVALFDALPSHQLWSLGDLAESIGLPPWQRARALAAPRLAEVVAALRARGTIVVGNHDRTELLRAAFGAGRVRVGGFELGAMRVRHGHEADRWRTRFERLIGPVAVPPFELAQQLRGGGSRKDNRQVRRAVGVGARHVLFGHSHVAALEADHANPGCFTASSQSFLLLDGAGASLWRRAAG
jgi:predicted phosphodiesterase